MATIYNSDLQKELRDGAKIQISRDTIPSKLGDTVVPTMEVNPKLLKTAKTLYSAELSSTTAGSPGTTIYTCSTTKDTYLSSIFLGFYSNAACDDNLYRIRVTAEDGQTAYPLAIWKTALTYTNDKQQVIFNPPLKLKRGSLILHYHTFTAGASTAYINLTGYEDDNTNA